MHAKGDTGFATVSRFNVYCMVKIVRVLGDGRLTVEVKRSTEGIGRGSRFVILAESFETLVRS